MKTLAFYAAMVVLFLIGSKAQSCESTGYETRYETVLVSPAYTERVYVESTCDFGTCRSGGWVVRYVPARYEYRPISYFQSDYFSRQSIWCETPRYRILPWRRW